MASLFSFVVVAVVGCRLFESRPYSASTTISFSRKSLQYVVVPFFVFRFALVVLTSPFLIDLFLTTDATAATTANHGPA